MSCLPHPLANPTLSLRHLDGSPPIPIGEGTGAALSPDGRWVLTLSGDNLVLLPTGAGAMLTLPKGNVRRLGDGAWLGDSKRIVFTGEPGDGKSRGYIQGFRPVSLWAITPEGVVLAGKAAVRDDNSILGRVGTTWVLFPVPGGAGRPVPALRPATFRCSGATTAETLYTVDNVVGERPPAVDVFRVEPVTGGRIPGKRSRRPTRSESKT